MTFGKLIRVLWIFTLAAALGDARSLGQNTSPSDLSSSKFISTRGTDFIQYGRRYAYMGANFWYGANLGADDASGDRARLIRELDRMHQLGITNLRIMAGSEGPNTEPQRMLPVMQPGPGQYHEAVLHGLDFLLVEMAKRSMHAVLCLSNYWQWSGGFAQYVSWSLGTPIPYPPPAVGGDWDRYRRYAEQFYTNPNARQAYANHLQRVVTRTNSITGAPYSEDPTIMAWELANEPDISGNTQPLVDWIRASAHLIKSLDRHHLVISGSEGTSAEEVDRLADIDYGTTHIWAQNAGWYDPKHPEETYKPARDRALGNLEGSRRLLASIGKPLVLAEFGLARDGERYAAGTPTTRRDDYYATLFDQVLRSIRRSDGLAGVNFWAWAGEGRPVTPGGWWSKGQPLIGDPPHEPQGWYSVYDSDQPLLQLIAAYSQLIRNATR